MQSIHIYESAWLTPFPHLVAPLHDEWFPGLLLRCDEVNRWSSGTTKAHLLHSISSYPTHLNRSFPFHLCPDCIAEERLLKRIFALPHITCCPFHQMQLVKACQCGTLLQIFHRQALPFTCPKCGLDWTNLLHLSADPERIALEQKFLSLYEFFFTKGTPTILAKAQQLVRESAKRKKTPWVRRPDGGGMNRHRAGIPCGRIVMCSDMTSKTMVCSEIDIYRRSEHERKDVQVCMRPYRLS